MQRYTLRQKVEENMDFIEYKRFAAFFKEKYDKVTKIMIIAGIIATIVGGIPALLGFCRVAGLSDVKIYFLVVAIAGVIVWGFGSGRIVKDFEFDDIFYRVSRDVREK